eukprot:COSAG01_NODE_3255_length_6346_cov_14.579638_2_plen_786_part_00
MLLLVWAVCSGCGIFLPEKIKWARLCGAYGLIRELSRKPVVGVVMMVSITPVYLAACALCSALRACWSSDSGKSVLTVGGWLVPDRKEKEDACYTLVRQLGQVPVIGGPIVVLVLPTYCVGKLVVAMASASYRCMMVIWEHPAGKVVLTVGGWLVQQYHQAPRYETPSMQCEDSRHEVPRSTDDSIQKSEQKHRHADVVFECVRSIGKIPMIGGPVALPLIIMWGIGRLVGDTWATHIGRAVLTLGGSLLPTCSESPCYFCIRKVAGAVPILGGPIALPALMLWCCTECIAALWRCLVRVARIIWNNPCGRGILTLGGSSLARPSAATAIGHPAYAQLMQKLGSLPLLGVLAVVSAVLYALGELLALLFFKRPGVRGAWWSTMLVTRRILLAVRVKCIYAMAVKLHRVRANIKNYFATRDLLWQQREIAGLGYQWPSWVLSSRDPPNSLEVYDPDLWYANQDVHDVSWPCQLVCEAIDRARSMTVLELYRSAGRCLAPADSTMLASTNYGTTRGALTFSSGTLSIGRLSEALRIGAKDRAEKYAEIALIAAEEGHATSPERNDASEIGEEGDLNHLAPGPSRSSREAQPPKEKDAEHHLVNSAYLLSDLRVKVSQLRTCVHQSPLMERQIDSILCSFLGQEALDSLRVGDRYQQTEAWVLLSTGLSSADLVRARRLRDSGQLSTRPDLLAILKVIEDTAAEDDGAALGREQIWHRLAEAQAVQQLPTRRPLVMGSTSSSMCATAVHNCYDYPQVVIALPTWLGTTHDGQLPVLRASAPDGDDSRP